ncbi:hypothetical protein I5U59_04035 [Stenotrophomonas maltophilia]|uniref:hypothetical protein n=2 Tax=Bacteria TaxID=2 RepID=UPI0006AA4A8C|nr:hypothetical protein [Stenotrophomonas maltophilia]ALA82154.1 hypothetical protein VN11_08770 [Stenotrophomonas maltophilia]MBH1477073.1 hypothetical protein [Stenotrophomonas maltophilia]MBH1502242.1 hypothetical protein [Stenotrophomonas maltophilia]MBH1784426.1 hypothetical protein [Stenotrophomonas maltophilia]
MKIKNNHNGPLGLPDGTILPPGEQTPVANWDQLKKNSVVQGWIKAEILSITGGDASGQAAGGSPGGEGAADKDALIARAKELGIDAKGNWGVPKLQQAIADAEKAAGGSPGGEG